MASRYGGSCGVCPSGLGRAALREGPSPGRPQHETLRFPPTMAAPEGVTLSLIPVRSVGFGHHIGFTPRAPVRETYRTMRKGHQFANP